MSSQQKDHIPIVSDQSEISLLDILIAFKWWLALFWKYRLLILVAWVSSLAAIFSWRHVQRPQYSGTLTMILSDDSPSSLGSMSGLLTQFGLPIQGNKYNIDKLIEIAKSRAIIQQTLFDTLEINGQPQWLINAFVTLYDLDHKWAKKDPEFENFEFSHRDFDNFSINENFAL